MKPENSVKVKFGVWGLIVGAVIVIIIGFAWGGWSTSSTTQKISDEAVLASQASSAFYFLQYSSAIAMA